MVEAATLKTVATHAANGTASSPLQALQQRFAIIDISGEIRILDRGQVARLLCGVVNEDLTFYKKAEAELLMKRVIENLPFQCKARVVIEEFWVSPNTFMYDGTAFNPTQTPQTILNLWVGPSPSANPGCWALIRTFLHDVICAGNSAAYEYLVRFMAHMIQKPEEKPGVMIVLMGGQGTGKGVYFSLLRAIWPRTTLLVSDIEQVTGRFNACLERHYIICMDEALFSGDRRSMDRLKSIVTESRVQVEQKYQPPRSIESVHRFFAASNHSHFGNIELDDRRFVFLQVSDIKQKDTSYFRELVAAINDPSVIGALLHDLKYVDLSSFDVRLKPNTNEHLKQKLKSLQGFDRFWHEVLVTGYLNGTGSEHFLQDNEWVGPLFVPTTVLVERYKEFHKTAQRHQTVQSAEVTASIERLCPSAKPDRQIWKPPGAATGTQRRGLLLPDLATARSDFEHAIKGNVQWG